MIPPTARQGDNQLLVRYESAAGRFLFARMELSKWKLQCNGFVLSHKILVLQVSVRLILKLKNLKNRTTLRASRLEETGKKKRGQAQFSLKRYDDKRCNDKR